VAKYDWQKLKIEYITGEWNSLAEFASANGVNATILYRRARAEKWQDEKVQRQSKKSTRIVQKTIEKQIESESEINTKHYELWVQILTKATALAKEADSGGQLKTLAEVIEKAQKGQRLARGMDKEVFKPSGDVRPINLIFKDTKREHDNSD